MIAEYILLIISMLFNMAGLFLILLRTGDYDADMFTKALGWLLFGGGFIGLISYKLVGLLLFIIGSLIVVFIRYQFMKKGKK